jgi:PadR family transcriptional regulator PadR
MPTLKFSQKIILEYIILTLISTRSYSASELLATCKRNNLNIRPGSLYPLLAELKRQQKAISGIEEMDTGPAQKCFSITDKGAERLRELRKNWRDINQLIYKITKT